jgi:hypothetical protein
MKNLSKIYVIILWSEALYQKNRIIEDLKIKFEIIEINIIDWSKNLFFENLFILYGGNLPLSSEKNKYSGDKPFYCLVIKDNTPTYNRITTKFGYTYSVNIKLYHAKELYRKWTSGGHKIHTSDNYEETNYQLNLLLGKSYEEYMSILPNKKINYLKQNLIYQEYKIND